MMNRLLLAALIAAFSALPVAAAAIATTATAPVLSERAKIDALIAAVERLPDAVFIRNGSEHDAKQAADHLRLKWKHGGKRIRTARDFIRHLATKSSLTGRKYRIRFADGKEVNSGDWMRQELAKRGGKQG